MKMTIEEINKIIIDNRTDKCGDINLKGLKFDKNVFIGSMEVGGDLFQSCQKVSGDLFQSNSKVKYRLYQGYQKVGGNLYQDKQKVERNLYQDCQIVGRDLDQSDQKVGCDYYCKGVEVNGVADFDKPIKQLKEVTSEELKEMGYKLIGEK